MLNKLNQKVNKLQMSLASQAQIQSELEQEVAEKNKDIDEKGMTPILINLKWQRPVKLFTKMKSPPKRLWNFKSSFNTRSLYNTIV